jgi:hypothetical protein
MATKELRFTLEGHRSGITTLAFSPDSKTLASTDIPTAIAKLWDVSTGKELPFVGPQWLDDYDDYIQDMVFSPDGKTLAVASFHAVGLWDVVRGRWTAVYGRGGSRPLCFCVGSILDWLGREPVAYVRSASYAPDGKLILRMGAEKQEWMQEVPGQPVSRLGVLCGLLSGLLFLGAVARAHLWHAAPTGVSRSPVLLQSAVSCWAAAALVTITYFLGITWGMAAGLLMVALAVAWCGRIRREPLELDVAERPGRQ